MMLEEVKLIHMQEHHKNKLEVNIMKNLKNNKLMILLHLLRRVIMKSPFFSKMLLKINPNPKKCLEKVLNLW